MKVIVWVSVRVRVRDLSPFGLSVVEAAEGRKITAGTCFRVSEREKLNRASCKLANDGFTQKNGARRGVCPLCVLDLK